MRKQSNLKAVKDATPEPLTYEQIDTLARSIAQDLADADEGTAPCLMLLMQEIYTNPFDHSHVETIANLLCDYLFAWTTREHDEAEELYIEKQRREFLARQKGGAQ